MQHRVFTVILFVALSVQASTQDDLDRAVEFHNLAMIRQALANGADPNKPDLYGRTPLRRIVLNTYGRNLADDADIVRELVRAGADVNQAMHWVVDRHTDLVPVFLELHADVNRLEDGERPLHAALEGSASRNVVDLLLASGADVNGLDRSGRTPLMLAARIRHFEIVRMLLERGARPDIVDLSGKSAADYADNEFIRAMITGTTPLDPIGHERALALLTAVRAGDHERVAEWLEKGVDVNVRIAGESALTQAAECGDGDLVRRLLKKGADTKGALRRAAVSRSWTIFDLLVDHATGEEISASMFYVACDAARLATLLDAGGDPNARSAYDGTVLVAAARGNCVAAVDLLLRRGANPGLPTSGFTNLVTPRSATTSPYIRARLDRAIGGRDENLFDALLPVIGSFRPGTCKSLVAFRGKPLPRRWVKRLGLTSCRTQTAIYIELEWLSPDRALVSSSVSNAGASAYIVERQPDRSWVIVDKATLGIS